MAKTDAVEAARFASTISDDWYRCQALAMVAWHTSAKPTFRRLAKEAFNAANKLPNPNRRVSCSAWIIRAIAKRGNGELQELVQKCLDDIRREENPVSRADALFLLYEAVFSIEDLRETVFEGLWASITEMKSWKKDRLLSNLALVVAEADVERAVEIARAIDKTSFREKTLVQIEKKEWLGPHEFFPNYTKSVEAHPVR